MDGSGAPAVAWYSNATGKHGVWYQGFDPGTTAPSGSPVNVPETSAGDQGLDLRGRIPLTSCPGQPGAWIAAQVGYPSQNKVILWKAGAAGATAIANGSDTVRNVGLACGPDGRLWVAWVRNNPLLLYVTRSNRSRTRFGAQAVVKLPSDAVDIGRLSADAQAGILDLVATISAPAATRCRAIQVLPALDIAVHSTFSVRRGGTVTIKAKVPTPATRARRDAHPGRPQGQDQGPRRRDRKASPPAAHEEVQAEREAARLHERDRQAQGQGQEALSSPAVTGADIAPAPVTPGYDVVMLPTRIASMVGPEAAPAVPLQAQLSVAGPAAVNSCVTRRARSVRSSAPSAPVVDVGAVVERVAAGGELAVPRPARRVCCSAARTR